MSAVYHALFEMGLSRPIRIKYNALIDPAKPPEKRNSMPPCPKVVFGGFFAEAQEHKTQYRSAYT
jgi:hypothetical protein